MDEAETHFKFCIDQRILNKQENTSDQSASYHNLGAVLVEKGKTTEAEKYYLKADEIDKRVGELSMNSKISKFDNMAKLYQVSNRMDEAEK